MFLAVMAVRGTANEEVPSDRFSWSGIVSSIMSFLVLSGLFDAANRPYSECRFLETCLVSQRIARASAARRVFDQYLLINQSLNIPLGRVLRTLS